MRRLRIAVVGTLCVCGWLTTGHTDSFTYVDEDGAEHTVEARLLGSGQDNHVLQRADGSLLVIPTAVVKERVPREGPGPISSDELVAQLEEQFGVELIRTEVDEPYVVALVLAGPLDRRGENRVRGFLRKAGTFMNNVERVFERYAEDMHFPLRDLEFPLALIIFESDADFVAHARATSRGAGLSADNISGYYFKLDNRLYIRLSECRTFEVPLHEAIHQQMYNRVFLPLAPIPTWFDEGIATGFENNGERVDVHPARINSRYAQLAMNLPARGVTWNDVVSDNSSFGTDILAGQAYVQAWSLHWMLATQHADAYEEYVQELAARTPLEELTSEQRTERFEDVFGTTIAELEDDFPRALESGIRRQRIRFPSEPEAGLLVDHQDLSEVRIEAVNRLDLGGRLTVRGSVQNLSPIRPLTFHVVVITETGVYADWVVPEVPVGRKAQLEAQVAAKVIPGALGGISQTFTVLVRSAVPGSETETEWIANPPVPELRRD